MEYYLYRTLITLLLSECGGQTLSDLIFYENSKGCSPVKDLISKLDNSQQPSDISLLKKIFFRFDIFEELNTRAPKEYVEHIQEGIWQIRIGRWRIFFFHWEKDKYVLLHPFMKKTQQTPIREIEQAKREKNDWLNRH